MNETLKRRRTPFFENEAFVEGDLVLIEKIGPRSFEVRKASKRGFNIYL